MKSTCAFITCTYNVSRWNDEQYFTFVGLYGGYCIDSLDIWSFNLTLPIVHGYILINLPHLMGVWVNTSGNDTWQMAKTWSLAGSDLIGGCIGPFIWMLFIHYSSDVCWSFVWNSTVDSPWLARRKLTSVPRIHQKPYYK